MATPTLKSYAAGLQLSASGVIIIPVVLTGFTSVLSSLIFTNSSTTTSRLVTVYVIPSGGTLGTTNYTIRKRIEPLGVWDAATLLDTVYEVGMSLEATQDAGTDVNVSCSGADIS